MAFHDLCTKFMSNAFDFFSVEKKAQENLFVRLLLLLLFAISLLFAKQVAN